MWEAIAYVSSGVTLTAFLAAVVAWSYKAKTEERERLIRAAKPEQRADLVRNALEFFHVDATRLNRDQQFALAIEQIHARAQRFKIAAAVICFLALVAAAIAAYAIATSKVGARTPPVLESREAASSPTQSNGVRADVGASTPVRPPAKPKPQPKPQPQPQPQAIPKALTWFKEDESGRLYSEYFAHESEDRQKNPRQESGVYHLTDKAGKIYRVDFRHVGEFCGWNYDPRGKTTGKDEYAGNTEIIEGGKGFIWKRLWGGRPCKEYYEAFYEVWREGPATQPRQ